jgi:hypothetical protein
MMEIRVEGTSIAVPVGWMVSYSKSPTLFDMYAPDEQDAFRENGNLVIEYLPRRYTLDEYYEAALSNLKPVFTGFTMKERNANYHVYSGTLSGITVQQVQFFFVEDRRAFIISFSSTPEEFDLYRDDFFAIARTFEILD